jgi:hypothetical protein
LVQAGLLVQKFAAESPREFWCRNRGCTKSKHTI